MKYFLPELYVQLNSPDDDLADAAEEAIDRAGEQYNRRWAEIRSQFPPAAVRFAEEQNLHDADVFTPARFAGPDFPLGGDVVLVAQQVNTLYAEFINTLAFLCYTAVGEPRLEIPVRSPVFRAGQPIWLYDELDLVAPGVFTHRILLSDGRVVTINFRDFRYHIAGLLGTDVLKALGSVLPAQEAPRVG
jgi:hypothetical protein